MRGPLRPLFAGLMQSRHIWFTMMRAIGSWEPESAAYRIIDRTAKRSVIIADGVTPPVLKANALMKRMRFPCCDGRRRFGFVLAETVQIDPGNWRLGWANIPLAALIIERSLQQEGTSVTYCLDVVDADHLGQAYEYGHRLLIGWWLHLVITADVEHIVRREIDDGVTIDVTVQITNSADKRIAAGLAYAPRLFDRPYVVEARARLGLS